MVNEMLLRVMLCHIVTLLSFYLALSKLLSQASMVLTLLQLRMKGTLVSSVGFIFFIEGVISGAAPDV